MFFDESCCLFLCFGSQKAMNIKHQIRQSGFEGRPNLRHGVSPRSATATSPTCHVPTVPLSFTSRIDRFSPGRSAEHRPHRNRGDVCLQVRDLGARPNGRSWTPTPDPPGERETGGFWTAKRAGLSPQKSASKV